jgi:ornithine carbamoyltransferase/carbamoyltransferase
VTAPSRAARGLLSLADLEPAELDRLVRRSVELHRDPAAHDRPLAGLVGGLLFTRTSTRTRTAFTVGIARLGGTPVAYGPADLQTATGETLEDTGRVLGSMLDLLVTRTAGPLAEMRAMAAGGLPVINAMAAEEHPTQGICDLATITVHAGDPAGVRLLYLGEGNNSAVALAYGLAAVPRCTVTFATPPGYGLPAGVLAAARARAIGGTTLQEVHDVDQLPDAVDVVYTTRWQTTGTTKPDPGWRSVFRPFQVDQALLDRWPAAVFLHDLPAHRGEEVTAEVLDGPRSLAWLQAGMKLSSATAVLERVAAG